MLMLKLLSPAGMLVGQMAKGVWDFRAQQHLALHSPGTFFLNQMTTVPEVRETGFARNQCEGDGVLLVLHLNGPGPWVLNGHVHARRCN